MCDGTRLSARLAGSSMAASSLYRDLALCLLFPSPLEARKQRLHACVLLLPHRWDGIQLDQFWIYFKYKVQLVLH